MKKWFSLLLVLVLLCTSAEAELWSLQFSLTGDLEAENWPAADQPAAEGLSELVQMTALKGTMTYHDTGMDNVYSFRLDADVTLDGDAGTTTPFSLYGFESNWVLQIPALGDMGFRFFLDALPEFAMKTYYHLNLPLQRLAVLLPYTTRSGLAPLRAALYADLPETVNRMLKRDEAAALAERVAAVLAEDHAFRYWSSMVAAESGWDEMLRGLAWMLPAWVEEHCADGLTVSRGENSESWAAGDVLLYAAHEDGFYLALPELMDGLSVKAVGTRDEAGTIRIRIDIGSEEWEVLKADCEIIGLPESLEQWLNGCDCTFRCDITGEAAGAGTHVRLAAESGNGLLQLMMLNPETGRSMLTLSLQAEQVPVKEVPDYWFANIGGVSVFSLNDESLREVTGGLSLRGILSLLPFMAKIPASAYVTLLDAVEENGILDMLAAGAAFGD